VIVTVAASLANPVVRVTASPRVSFDIASAEAGHRDQPDNVEVASIAPAVSLQDARDAESLAQGFARIGYHFDRVRDEGAPVPRVFLAKLPEDLHAVPEVALKKTVFFQTMLPLVLKENERILADRHRLHGLKVKKALGRKLPARDRLWLAVMAERYKVKDENVDALLQRVDVIPPSLAMAQAAEESGWGTSRFAQAGNALFGQWTTTGDEGIVPNARDEGADHKVKTFETLSQSVAAYMRNLNTHRAYRAFRTARTKMRQAGAPLDGFALAGTLTRYSERGPKYVKSVRTIIDSNGLSALDDARLKAPNGAQSA